MFQNESSWKQKFQGVRVPKNESSNLWNFHSWERTFLRAKVPVTIMIISCAVKWKRQDRFQQL